jgi:hypothetical protein
MIGFKDMETFNTWLCSLLRCIILILIFSLFVYYNLMGQAETSVALKKNKPAEGRGLESSPYGQRRLSSILYFSLEPVPVVQMRGKQVLYTHGRAVIK